MWWTLVWQSSIGIQRRESPSGATPNPARPTVKLELTFSGNNTSHIESARV